MRSDGAARVIAGVLVFGMIAGFASTYLSQAGVPMWGIVLAVVLVVSVPVIAALRSSRSGKSR